MGLLTPDVEPLWIARYDYLPGWQLPPHEHDDYFQMILILSGDGEVLVGDTRVPLESNLLLLIRPTLVHALFTAEGATVRTLDTKFRIRRPQLHRACERLDPIHQHAPRWVVSLLEAMHSEALTAHPETPDICQTLLTQVLLILLRKNTSGDTWTKTPPPSEATEKAGMDLCGRIERFLYENCAREIHQKTLSEAFHYSYRHLNAVWRQRHEDSPLQALWRFRAQRAMELIRYSDYELKRIAEMTGFSTVHHFSRVFTAFVGESPARWRERECRNIRRDVVIRSGFSHQIVTIQSPAAKPDKGRSQPSGKRRPLPTPANLRA